MVINMRLECRTVKEWSKQMMEAEVTFNGKK